LINKHSAYKTDNIIFDTLRLFLCLYFRLAKKKKKILTFIFMFFLKLALYSMLMALFVSKIKGGQNEANIDFLFFRFFMQSPVCILRHPSSCIAHLLIHTIHDQSNLDFHKKYDISLLLLDSDRPSVSYCNICRKYSDFADQKSLMFIGKIVHRMDT
jgi:hypothetical protein